jgi:hypothetical protein
VLDYSVSWEEAPPGAPPRAPSRDWGEGRFDADRLQSKGIFRLVKDSFIVDQQGDPIHVKSGEYVHLLSDAEIEKYAMADWVYAAGESLQVRLHGATESILPSTLLAVMPEGWEPGRD